VGGSSQAERIQNFQRVWMPMFKETVFLDALANWAFAQLALEVEIKRGV